MQLLPGADADDLDRQPRRNRLRKIGNPHRRYLRNEDLTALHAFKALEHKRNAVLQPKPEARHARIGHGKLLCPLRYEPFEKRHHRAAASDHVAVTYDGEPCRLCTDKVIRSREELVRT